MNPILLLGAVIAFVFLSRKTAPVDVAVKTETPTPTFSDTVLSPKTKAALTAPLVYPVSMSPPAEGTMPPYVYSGVPELATFGATESGLDAPLMV